MKYRTDDLTLLLSTDWFLQAWGHCGLLSSSKAATEMSMQCRGIVKGFVGENSSYWDVEYSLPRMKETERQFLRAMNTAQLVAHDCETLSGLNRGLTSNQEASGNTALILNLLMLLVSDAGSDKDLRDGITPTMFERIQIALEQSASEDFSEIASIAAQASSQWDKWVESITSEVPGLLLDVARDVRDYNGPASALWGGLCSTMSDSEMSALVEWLNRWGQQLAGVQAIAH